MNIGNKGTKAQSAMEYLMTYGWAILIIAVVLAVLFSLNVFNAGAQLGTACIGTPGYSCSSPSITQQGALSFTMGQGVGYTIYNAVFACISSANSVAAPGTATMPFNTIKSTGEAQTSAAQTGAAVSPSNSLANSASLTISGLQCYPTTGTITNMLQPIGTSFTGAIWLAYSTTQGGTPQFVKVATLSIKSTS